jgi:microcystin-dependent protein
LTPTGGGNAPAGSGWGFTTQRTDSQQPPVHINAAATGIGATDSRSTGVSILASATSIGIQNAGGGAAHNIMPPYIQINFMVKYA